MESKRHFQVQYRVVPQFHLLQNHVVHSHALPIANKRNSSTTWNAPFSAISGAPFVHPYIDPQVHLYMQFRMCYQVQPKFYRQADIKHIYHCFDALSLASPDALTISLLLSYF